MRKGKAGKRPELAYLVESERRAFRKMLRAQTMSEELNSLIYAACLAEQDPTRAAVKSMPGEAYRVVIVGTWPMICEDGFTRLPFRFDVEGDVILPQKAVAAELGVSLRTLQRWRRAGLYPLDFAGLGPCLALSEARRFARAQGHKIPREER